MPSTTFYNLKNNKQQELLHNALVLFAHNHYDDLNVRYISKEMGITTGAFYRYFGSKEEFYIFMVDYTLEQFWAKRNEIIRQMGKEEGAADLADKEKSKQIMEKIGRKIGVQEVLDRDGLQAGFWKFFYQSSLDIRMKYYFRTKGNPLYNYKLDDLSRMKNADTYSEEEKEITAFAIAVLQYVVTSFKYLEHRDFDDDEMFQMINKMILKGFEQGKSHIDGFTTERKPPILNEFEE